MSTELERISHYTRLAYEKGYVSGTSGNTSIRGCGTIYITATGGMLGAIGPEDFVPVSLSGNSPCAAAAGPSKELQMHLEIYKRRPDINAVFHLHPVEGIAATLLLQPGNALALFSHTHKKKLGAVLHTDYFPAGSTQLALEVAELFARSNAVLLYRHGIAVGGKDVEAAFVNAEYLIEACRLYLCLRVQNDESLLDLALKDA